MEPIEKCLKAGDFKRASELMKSHGTQELEDFIVSYASESEDVTAYLFILYLIFQDETAELHAIASVLLEFVFPYIEGATSVAFEHVKKANELTPSNVTYLEMLLFYYEVPEKLLSKGQAIETIESILMIDPDNSIALAMKSKF